MRNACLALLISVSSVALCADGSLLPWQSWIEKASVTQTRELAPLFGLPWRSSGGREGKLSLWDQQGPWGGACWRFDVQIDHHNAGQYPMGWPSFETVPAPPLDYSGYDALQYWVRFDTNAQRRGSIRFILWTDGALRINTPLPPLQPGEWTLVTHRIRDLPHIDKVDRLHFYLCEDEYTHGEELTFLVGGFQLCNLEKELSRMGENEGALGLWLGQRADTGDQAVIVDEASDQVPALMVIETGAEFELRVGDELALRFREVFSGQETRRRMPLGESAPAGQVSRLERTLPVDDLAPGYYLVVADILRDGQSLLGGRVGCDDLYIRKPDESMTYTVLSIRAGMVQWVRDLLHGDVMCRTQIALPHVYDPLDPATYPQFLQLFAQSTGKHTEGNEAGDTGLVLAAEAFRKSGDMVRCRYVEGLLEDSFRQMIDHMQAPGGATITWVNQLADAGIGKGGRTNAFGSYDSNQIGEWIRPLAYGVIYYSQIPGREDYARELSRACRRAADFIVAHSLQDSDGIPGVMRHLRLQERQDGSVEQVVYHQEGRQCDVYLGRALAGLSCYAYAMQLLGETVPDNWWQVMDNTVQWCDRKMKPNGWFDWQCEDTVEGGCHTFLGNIYVGEGMFGCALAARYAGRNEQADRAAAATRKAYRYVTDDCWIKGRKFEYPLEFWVGPYVYWLFTEYLDTLGPDERFEDWLVELDRRWSVERGWRDFLDRAPTGGCGRTTTNGMLEVSILGYLAIKQMSETGQPLHWATAP